MEELKASFNQIQGFYFVSSLTGQVGLLCGVFFHKRERERERERAMKYNFCVAFKGA